MESLVELREEFGRFEQEQSDAAFAVAAELGVELFSVGGAAPFMIRGRVDGRGFFVRCRHDQFTIEVAPPDRPGVDPYELPRQDCLLVADGVEEELLGPDGSWAHAVRFAVDSVRVSLRRAACSHDGPLGAWFCPWCGERLAVGA